MKILEYLIRFKNDTKAGADAAAKTAFDLSKKVKAGMEADAKTVSGQLKGFFSELKDESGKALAKIPGGSILADLMKGTALGITSGAIAAGTAINRLITSIGDRYRELGDRMEQDGIRMAAKQAQIISKFRASTSSQSEIGIQNDLIGEISQAQAQLAELRSDRAKRGLGGKMLQDVGMTGDTELDEIRGVKNKITLYQRQLDLSRERESRFAVYEAGAQEYAASKRLADERASIIAGMTTDPLEGMYNRGDRRGLESAEAGAVKKIQSILSSQEPITEESNSELERLGKSADRAGELLDKMAKESNESAAKFWADQDAQAAKLSDFQARLKEERIGQLTPEKQLAARRAEYRAVVTEGRNTADPEKKLELANRAMELRAIMRPLIDSLAGAASEGGDDEGGGRSSGATRRTRRGPLGLGRLSGNRAGYRFGRILSSQFDGQTVGGNSAPPAKRPMEDIGEEQLRVLKRIEEKTGFGKGG